MKTITINEIKLEVPDSEVEELVKKYSKKETLGDILYADGKIFYIDKSEILEFNSGCLLNN